MSDIKIFSNNFQEVGLHYGTQIIAALIIFLVGLWCAAMGKRLLNRFMLVRKTDATVRLFMGRLVYLALLIFTVIAALAKLGVDTTSVIAILGAASLAVGLALRNSLADFAAGILLILMRPFKVGDLIDISIVGRVEEINFLYTQLITSDGKCVMIPNGKLMSSNMINYSTYPHRRGEITFNISYEADPEKAKALLQGIISQHSGVLKDPTPLIVIQKLNDNSMTMLLRFWTLGTEVDDTIYFINNAIIHAFSKADISLTANQQQVIVNNHLIGQN